MSGSVVTRSSALLFSAATFLRAALPSRAQNVETIRLALLPAENAAEPLYAKDAGFFIKAGLDIDARVLTTGSAIAGALVGHDVDIGWLPVDALAIAHQKGIGLTMIAPGADYLSPLTERTAALIVPSDSTLQSAKDLTGKILAVNALNALSENGPRVWIDKNGGDSATVRFIEIPYSAMGAALAADRVDAAFVVEPFLSDVRKNGRVLVYGYNDIAKHFLIGGWCTTPQWAAEHADQIARFAATMRQTAAWANGNQTASSAILAKDLKIDPARIATMARAHYAEELTAMLVQPLVDVSAKYNGFAPFSARELIYAPPH